MWDAFRTHLTKILPDTAPAILEAIDQPQYPSIRLNPMKPGHTTWTGSPVHWESQGLQLDHQPAFIRDPLWHAGVYYVQESSSMFLGHLLRDWLRDKASAHPLLALDLCAAPGGKSTQLLDLLPAEALLVSNELIPKRNAILRENLIRWGRPNILVTQNEPVDFLPYAGQFDLVLVDAPCSGEGLFRRDRTAIAQWSVEAVEQCALRQQNILDVAARLLKPGGLLLYSTCTFEPSENEAQVERVLLQGFEQFTVDTKDLPGITEGLLPGTFRFYPHLTPGSGFFIGGLIKTDHTPAAISAPRETRKRKALPMTVSDWGESAQWIDAPERMTIWQTPFALHAFPKAWDNELLYFNQQLHITYFGCELGERKKDLFIPAHALALSKILNTDLPAINTDRENALRYLRKETLDPPEKKNAETGWRLLRYEGLNLGWVKVLPDRINNYLPAAWRILH